MLFVACSSNQAGLRENVVCLLFLSVATTPFVTPMYLLFLTYMSRTMQCTNSDTQTSEKKFSLAGLIWVDC